MATALTQLYIVAGQSNAMGECSLNSGLPTSLQSPQENVNTYYNGNWQPLQPGMGVTTANFGPEVTFGRDLATALPNEHVGLIKYAVGSTDLQNDWRAGSTAATSGPQYIALLQTIHNAIAALGSGPAPEIVGVAWMQGESDAIEGSGPQYETNLTNFITQLRSDLNQPTLKFGIGEILSCWNSVSPNGNGATLVRQAEADVGLTISNVTTFDTDDLTTGPDFGHYNTAGEMALGDRFAATMVPEPSSLALLLMGIVSLAYAWWKRN